MTHELRDMGVYYSNSPDTALNLLGKYDPNKILDQIPDEVFDDFVTGMKAVHSLIFEHEKPDVIIAPTRGAEPLLWALEEISESKETEMPIIAKPPIGTGVNIYKGRKQSGIKGQEKNLIIGEYLETIREIRNGEPTKILLLDEARTGGAISQAMYHVRKHLLEMGAEWDTELVGVAAHDSSSNNDRVSKSFKHFIENKPGQARTHKISLAMPQIDKTWLLPMILRQDPKIRPNENLQACELRENWPNTAAKAAYKEKISQALDRLNSTG